MISFSSDLTIIIAITSIDFRCGINTLAPIAQKLFERDPKSGSLFVFKNRRGTDIKMIFYDVNGFFLGHKRLSKGKLAWWPRTEGEALGITAVELMKLLRGVDPRGSFHPEWRKLNESKIRVEEQATDHHPIC